MKQIRTIIAAFLVLSPFAVNATVIITAIETSGDVVFDISGSLDLTGATIRLTSFDYISGIIGGGDNWYVAAGSNGQVDSYVLTSFDGAFGTSEQFFDQVSASFGDDFSIWGNSGLVPQVSVSTSYISGAMLSAGLIFSGETFASLSLLAGTYNYAIPSDNIKLIIGAAAIPVPTTLSLLGAGLLGFGMAGRRRTAN